MENISSFLETVVDYLATVGVSIAELCGVVILLITVFKAIVGYFKKAEHLTIDLAEGICLSLEFKLGGEVLRTVIAENFNDLLMVGLTIVLRFALTLILHWEVSAEKRSSGIIEPHIQKKAPVKE